MDFDIICNPEAHGYQECDNCNGYGSALHEDADKCTKCGGHGVVPKKKEEFNGNAMHLLEELPDTSVDGRMIPAGKLAVAGPGGKVGIFDPDTGRTQY